MGTAVFHYKIYADNLSEPIIESLSIEQSIQKKDMTYEDVLTINKEIQKKNMKNWKRK